MADREPPVYYSDYLQIAKLLDCQKLESERRGKPVHDEILFIIVHQTYELWFKQILFELDAVLAIFGSGKVDERQMGRLVSHLARVVEIEQILIQQITVLETMTPLDFLDFRGFLAPASGFQSVQFRRIENLLGVRPAERIPINEGSYKERFRGDEAKVIDESERATSLFREVEKWLERTPFLHQGAFVFWETYREAVAAMVAADRRRVNEDPRLSDETRVQHLKSLAAMESNFEALFDKPRYEKLVEDGRRRLSHQALLAALLINLYRDEPALQLPFRMLTLLVDVDELFTNWRYRHALMAARMIGSRIGTGGTSGADYLRQTADRYRVFTDLVDLSTFFIPRSELPALPPEVRSAMGFRFSGT